MGDVKEIVLWNVTSGEVLPIESGGLPPRRRAYLRMVSQLVGAMNREHEVAWSDHVFEAHGGQPQVYAARYLDGSGLVGRDAMYYYDG